MASCGRVRLFEGVVGVCYDTYLGKVEYQGLMVFVFRSVGCYPRVCVRVGYGCVRLS